MINNEITNYTINMYLASMANVYNNYLGIEVNIYIISIHFINILKGY